MTNIFSCKFWKQMGAATRAPLWLFLWLCLTVASCGADGSDAPQTASDALGGADATTVDGSTTGTDVAPDTAPSTLEVHQWGTFTVFQDSTGTVVQGVQRAEEALPSFVHLRSLGPSGSGAAETLPAGVTFKLHSPLFFMHSNVPKTVQIQASFPLGIFSAYWPAAGAVSPAIGAIKTLSGGKLTWPAVALIPGGTGGPKVTDKSFWHDLRQSDATPIKVAKESAAFAFYQGLGSQPPMVKAVSVKTGSSDKPDLHVTNNTGATITAAWYIHVHSGGGMFTHMFEIPNGVTKVGGITPKENNAILFSQGGAKVMQTAMVAHGLTEAEAKAVVASWAHNYFKTPGRRLLYIAPPSWVATHLPTAITPKPAKHVRLMIGRIEVISAVEEAAIITDVKASAQTGSLQLVADLGIFAEPKLRRAAQLLPAGAAKTHCQKLIAKAAQVQ